MSSCRDCSRSTPASARSCPHCGILNPVVQWVAYPDGSHHTARVAPDPVAAAAALAGKPAPRPAISAPAKPSAPRTPSPAASAASAWASGPGASSGTAAPFGGSASAEAHSPFGAAAPAGAYGAAASSGAAADPFAIFAPGGAAPLPLAAAVPVEDLTAEIEAINRCSTAFFWLAGLNAVLGLLFREVLGNGLLIDAGMMAALSYALRTYRSRVAAGLLVLYAGFTVYTKAMALLAGAGAMGWVWMWVLITGMAVKATMATVTLNEQRPSGALA